MRTVIALWDAALLSLGRSSGPSKVSQTHNLPTFNTPQALSSDEQTALCRASVSSFDPLVLTKVPSASYLPAQLLCGDGVSSCTCFGPGMSSVVVTATETGALHLWDLREPREQHLSTWSVPPPPPPPRLGPSAIHAAHPVSSSLTASLVRPCLPVCLVWQVPGARPNDGSACAHVLDAGWRGAGSRVPGGDHHAAHLPRRR